MFMHFRNISNLNLSFDDPKALAMSGINPKYKTVFLIHGFRNKNHSSANKMGDLITKAYIRAERNYNIITVNWNLNKTFSYKNTLSEFLRYRKVVMRDVPRVCDILTHVIHRLVQNNCVSLKNIHIVGHSLGSHIGGCAGNLIYKKYGNKIARITGLDPASVLFEGRFKTRRPLNKTNADFVDIYHTAAFWTGMSDKNLGHADFFRK